MFDCVLVRNEFYDANSFPELFPYYSLLKYVIDCFEAVVYPSFFFGHHKAIMSPLTRMIDFASAALFPFAIPAPADQRLAIR